DFPLPQRRIRRRGDQRVDKAIRRGGDDGSNPGAGYRSTGNAQESPPANPDRHRRAADRTSRSDFRENTPDDGQSSKPRRTAPRRCHTKGAASRIRVPANGNRHNHGRAGSSRLDLRCYSGAFEGYRTGAIKRRAANGGLDGRSGRGRKGRNIAHQRSLGWGRALTLREPGGPANRRKEPDSKRPDPPPPFTRAARSVHAMSPVGGIAYHG